MPNNPVRPEAHKILEILPQTKMEWTFRVENHIPIRHGQFMQVSIPKFGEAPISISGFGDGYADFTIRKVGKVTDELFNLKEGDYVFLRGCYGNGWPADRLKDRNIVIIAGGTGISPVKSIINALYDNADYAREIYLILGFKNSQSILFADELERWKKAKNFHTVYTLDDEEYRDWNRGMVTDFIEKIPFKRFSGNYECLVVGPPVMMKFVGKRLLEDGIPEDKIWMSFERKMSCAIGKCGHCRIDEVYVCLDGPIFNYTTGKKLVD
ncbi:anaerobic sulfite reductase subunit AsrB [Clostridium luticellarii]|jgi:anaerobic sulfite reductase subunit B|uniref:Anaerobic sulfite reductase subunit B n=1 Tax=Clostridium luticellarii TaxID=1691940 RepID=A0A2T0BMQ2_9CLOT|nr:anaerobic sulfite reductase subunit AsrB [Clostridium luticellarii]MCI1945744.1 anaerobic sulfite reductase subunit AsrB [Clostridium luticellarii]MCI1969086.1 anaerobic sulfite reductase subunit AsrB [Clostridium luticellarii]MCI1996324.1 anaerobic sulfite reductase subunit AsrB [Clostridium luticellarii]MCI2040651.1 anaerobic sulfite reductase subunit AsrB [Clostridium luticellarii]PRR85160.1 Anaerobic sulfite reductase subunit B [Clostridium luticellarii]